MAARRDPSPAAAMPTYRAYAVNRAGKITWGEWIEARDLEEARMKALKLCDKGHPTVELWKGGARLDQVACDES